MWRYPGGHPATTWGKWPGNEGNTQESQVEGRRERQREREGEIETKGKRERLEIQREGGRGEREEEGERKIQRLFSREPCV